MACSRRARTASERRGEVDSLAAHFVREMRAVQARGPYFLGGSSYGGIVAFEMAQ